jgi:prevent-host-death family protein
MHEAKTHFSKLAESAIHGEETIIAKAGKPVAKLVPISAEKPKRPLGVLKDEIRIGDDFDAPLPNVILNSFEGHL